jgi:hypothetical protein
MAAGDHISLSAHRMAAARMAVGQAERLTAAARMAVGQAEHLTAAARMAVGQAEHLTAAPRMAVGQAEHLTAAARMAVGQTVTTGEVLGCSCAALDLSTRHRGLRLPVRSATALPCR